MSQPNSPMDALVAQVRRLIESGAPSDLAGQLNSAVEQFMTAYRPVSNLEFESRLEALSELEAQVQDLTRRVEALEAKGE